jgi:hypothetical protein
VIWNSAIAAADYIAAAASKLSSALGPGKIAGQFVKGLETLGSAMEWALDEFLTILWNAISGEFKAVLNPLSSELRTAKSVWVGLQLSAANSTVAYMEDGSTLEASAESGLARALALPYAFDIAITTVIAILLYLAIPFDIEAEPLTVFLVPIAISVFGATMSIAPGTSLLGPAQRFISEGLGSGFRWIDSLAEWIWNDTHSISLSTGAITSFIAPGVPGDHFALIAALIGGVGFITSTWSASIAESKLGLSAAAQVYLTYASAGLALIAALLAVGVYLLSAWAPSGTATNVAEAILDIVAMFFGSYAILCAVRALLVAGEEAVIPPASYQLGLIGLLAGVGSDAAGGFDLYELSTGG